MVSMVTSGLSLHSTLLMPGCGALSTSHLSHASMMYDVYFSWTWTPIAYFDIGPMAVCGIYPEMDQVYQKNKAVHR